MLHMLFETEVAPASDDHDLVRAGWASPVG